jgi:uncharacterized delta-60 repeat protein
MFLRSSWIVRVLCLSCCILAGAVGSAAAAPGDVDRSFGREGVLSITTDPANYASPDDMVVGPDGSIYTLQTVERCTGGSCVLNHPVSRFQPNGGPDTSFGVGGTSTAIGSPAKSTYLLNASMALGPDGRVVVASVDNGQLVLSRLNPDGSLDGGFGVGGAAAIDFGTPVSRARVAVQGDGRIVVVAEPQTGYGGDAVIIARYTVQGTPDPAFHAGTPVFTSLGSGFGGFALTAAGKPVLAGPRCCSADGRAVHLLRLDESGAFDSTFGPAGERFVDDVSDGVGVGAVVVTSKGRIYVVGSGRGKGDAFVLKLRPNGKLDTKFGNRGVAYMRRSFLDVAGLGIDRAGRLLIFGTSPTGSFRGPGFGSRRLTVLRRLSDGRRDPTFAGGSLVRLGSLGPTRVAGGGLQKGRALVVLASSGSCIRTCPSPKNFLVRFIGGTSGSRCDGRRATIVGTRHGEKLVGTRGPDVIAALAGNDLVRGRGGNDVICGGRGDDRLGGGKGRDVLRGGAGHNQLSQ